MAKEARKSAESHSAKYFALSVLKVYEKAIGSRGIKKRGFLDRMKKVIKRGIFNG